MATLSLMEPNIPCVREVGYLSELYILNQALTLLKGQGGTTYTCSKYAYGVVHTSGGKTGQN